MGKPMPERDEETGELIVPMRLQKFLARSGVASRRGSEKIISAGCVSVNGEIITELGTKVHPREDVVKVNGSIVTLKDSTIYLMLNKPQGYITTMSDPYNRPTVKDIIPIDKYPGLFPVGRLDRDTTGIILFMTDGVLGRDLLHPGMQVYKTYQATVERKVSDAELDVLRNGVMLSDGITAPAELRILKAHEVEQKDQRKITEAQSKKYGRVEVSHVEITIHEGRTHQVKRMFDAIEHSVVALHRKAFGPLGLTDLAEGDSRLLSPQEVDALKYAAYGDETPLEKKERLKLDYGGHPKLEKE
ncbi:MAG: pseudouridine synthase [Coriobacteriia bacterium]|nr:pseudouridine synthase [Coriobacteriia bacterium]